MEKTLLPVERTALGERVFLPERNGPVQEDFCSDIGNRFQKKLCICTVFIGKSWAETLSVEAVVKNVMN